MTGSNQQGSGTEQDVVDVLTADHREFLDLVAQIKKTPETDRRRDLADILIAELVRHAVAEETHVYPAMRTHLPDGDEAAEHDTEEHKELERVMKELEGLDPTDARFTAVLDELEQNLRHHVEDEEGEQFPALRRHIPREDLVALAGKVETTKRVAPTRPHPSAPNTKLFHLLAGPGVGLVDRLRDRLTGRSTG
jgi:hemerythrin-like domain-containing protein